MAFILSPNMQLPVPTVGQESGPQYAFDINSSLTLVDSHDHTPGKGVQITPSGLNINNSLAMNNNFLVSTAGVTFQAQGSTAPLNTVYEKGVDLYYVDGNGNDVRLTQSGGVAGSPGSISNLTSPASASYVSGLSTFVWQSGTGIAANMDLGALLLRNLSPNSTFAITLQPPAALSSNYTITLPALPATTSFLTITSSGTMASSVATAQGIITSMIADQAVTAGKIATSTITQLQVSPGTLTTTSLSASAGILPSQTNSTGVLNNAQTTAIQQFTTSSTSPVPITDLEVNVVTAPDFVFNNIRPVFLNFSGTGSPGEGTIVVTGGTAAFEMRWYNSASFVTGIQIVQLPVGSYPASVLNCMAFPSAGNRIRVFAFVTSGSVVINPMSITAVQF